MDERHWGRVSGQDGQEYTQAAAEAYYDDIYRFCCYRTGDREAAYDLTQETFLRFIKYAGNCHRIKLKGYLLTIAMNVCRDFFRQRKVLQDFCAEEETADNAADISDGPEALAVENDQNGRLLALLGNLPDMQREAIILRYYYEMKFREIARLTGVGTATAKSRVKQGMEKLRELLGEEDFYEA